MALVDSCPATNLQPRLTRFVGRAHELDRLIELMTAGQRLLTIFGSAGTGKTRIALALAERLVGEHGGGSEVWWCELAPASDLEGLCHTIADTLGVPPSSSPSGVEAVQRLGAAIAARGPIVLVLDNFEQLASLAPSTVSVWLREAPELRVIITSREHLRLRGELRFELPPLSLPQAGDDPSDCEAVVFLVDRLQALEPDFILDERTTPHVVDLVRRLEGLPLALELAAAQVELLGLQGLLDNLHQSLDVLVADARDENDRHATLRAAIGWSWNRLKPLERAALAQCTVFAGGFMVEAAKAVLQVGPAGRSALPVLKALRDKSLLRRGPSVEHAGHSRFYLYEVIREFAAEQFESDQAKERAQTHHAAYYRSLAERCTAQIGTAGGSDALRTLAGERDNLRAAHAYAMGRSSDDDQAFETALHCVLALDLVASIRGPLASHLRMLEQTLGESTPGRVDPALWVRALRARARCRMAHGQVAGGLGDLGTARDVAEAAANPQLQAEVLVELGVYHHQCRQMDHAQALYEQALGHARAAGGTSLEGRILGNLGALHHDRHALDDARTIYRDALELLRTAGDARLEAIHVGNLGVLELEQGHFDRARGYFEASRELLHPLGDRRLEAIVRGNLGTLEHTQGQRQAARHHHEQALAMLREVGDRRSEALCLSRLGRVTAALGWVDDARGCFAAADRQLGRFPDPMVEAAVRLDRGFVEVAQARRALAEGHNESVESNVQRVRERIAEVRRAEPPDASWVERSDDIRFAVGLLESALDDLSSSTTSVEPNDRRKAALIIGPQGGWLQPPGGAAQDLRRRKALRLIVLRLVAQHRDHPGAGLSLEVLLETGWPAERVLPSAGANRVYVALTTLRKLGLRKILLSQDDGYLLDPALPIEMSDDDGRARRLN